VGTERIPQRLFLAEGITSSAAGLWSLLLAVWLSDDVFNAAFQYREDSNLRDFIEK